MTRSFRLHLNDQAVSDKRGRGWLFVVGHQAWHKFRSGAIHLQFCGQNLATTPNWYSALFGKLPNGQASICARRGVDFVNVWIVSWRWRTPRTLVVVIRLSPTLETFVPLETCSTLHCNIAVSRVEHGKCFSCRFPEFYTIFHCAPSGCPFYNSTNEKRNTLYLKSCSLSTNEDICDRKTAF